MMNGNGEVMDETKENGSEGGVLSVETEAKKGVFQTQKCPKRTKVVRTY
jgi:hypothetical protein